MSATVTKTSVRTASGKANNKSLGLVIPKKRATKKVLIEPDFEEETIEQYELIMALSKETNRAIAKKINEIRNLNLPL